jgi:micrococcal nuclease
LVISRFLFSAAVVAAFLMPHVVFACEDLVDGPRGTVTEVVDGDTVFLDNGLQVRLIGTQAPKLPLGRDGFETWPMADEAKAALEDLVLGQNVIVRYVGEDRDRYDRVLGQMFVEVGDGEVWVQEKMLLDGLARVYSFADNRSCLATLFAAEERARTMQLGIWTDTYYQIRRADRPQALLERVDHYEIVEGRVFLAEAAGQGVYLNFGRIWKEDFTVVIGGGALRLFADSGLDPLMLEGALVRVRGWVDERDGPRMEVTHPEQIEVLSTR